MSNPVSALAQSSFSFDDFFQRHTCPMLLVHASTCKVMSANPQAVKQYGWTLTEFQNLALQDFTLAPLEDFGQKPEGQLRVPQKAIGGQVFQMELTWQTHGETVVVTARNMLLEQALQQELEHQISQMQRMAELPRLLYPETSMDAIHQTITDAAREIIGAHQAVTSLSENQNWEQMLSALSLSEKYAEYRDFDPPPTGKGIYVMVCENNRSMRLSQSELESHPRWRNFSEHQDTHPPMRGWLAVPLIGRDGKNLGLIQLSDKYEGEFTELDEIMLMQFAHVASSIIESSKMLHQIVSTERRMNVALQAAEVGYWEWDMPTGNLFWDEKTAELMGVPLSEFSGRIEAFYDALREDDQSRVMENISHALENHVPYSVSFRVKGITDHHHRMARGRFHYRDNGTAYLFTGIIMDITERVQALDQLQESERKLRELMQVQKRFIADAAHELRTPLTAIQGNLDMFTRFPHIPEQDKKEILSDVQREATRLGRLVNDMLQLARGDAGAVLRSDELELHQVVQAAWKQIERVSEHHTITLGPLEHITLEGDSDRLKQLTLILLENALKYTPEGGTVHLALQRNQNCAELRVQDNGYGISPQDLERVFERFYRADQSRHRGEDPGGTGLGLPIARWIVEQHGGHIWLESEVGKGTVAVVQLPIQEPEQD
ncbi:GAF domain-containing sensor histidine kinase [Deinococcus misasensis]|uniref:sensor histidine kinase n=1 Tax=Deinococcus misasensis TaxID=392413 RepID=UPI00068D6C22|nr:GAF domain-containing sensor histidine kinase [Deinococcus misasensis]